jgi:hypothetical protein
MPTKINAYACQYRCGRIGTKRAAIVAHEARCFRNPETSSCQTCGHATRETDQYLVYGSGSHEIWRTVEFVSCAADETIDLTEKLRTACSMWKRR